MPPLTIEQLSVLRTLRNESWRVFDGRELLERIFATTTETPLDAEQICEIVRAFEQWGWVRVIRTGQQDDEFDFAGVQITDLGREES